MSNTPNHGIPYVPEGTLDPAAGLNDSLDTIDALIQCAVIDFLSTPPVSPADGDMYIVDPTGTGDWTGYDNRLVRYVADGDFWQSFVAGSQVSVVVNRADSAVYIFDEDSSGGEWTAITGASASVMTVSDLDSSDITTVNTVSEIIFSGASVTDLGGGVVQVDIEMPVEVDRDVLTTPTNSAGTVTLNYALGDYFKITLAANVTTLAFSNLPGSTKAVTLMLQIIQGSGPYTFAWPASFKWAGGTVPSISTANGAVDVLAMTTFDNGTTWRATLAKAFA